jgi:hypothetical protein
MVFDTFLTKGLKTFRTVLAVLDTPSFAAIRTGDGRLKAGLAVRIFDILDRQSTVPEPVKPVHQLRIDLLACGIDVADPDIQ